MKVICPTCQTTSRISEAKIPPQGAYARCPKCQERFFIKRPKPAAKTPDSRTGEAATPRSGMGPARPPLASSLRPPPVPDQEYYDGDQEPPTLLPEPEAWRGWYVIAAVFLLLAGTVSYYTLGRQSNIPLKRPARPLAQRPAGLPSPAEVAFERDLTFVRRAIMRRNFTSYTVEIISPEMRLLFDLLDRCGGDCPAMFKASLHPLAGQDGFTAEVSCLEKKTYQVRYLWTVNELTVNGHRCR
ncbi:MAG: zinc-ribbon domain-containing protein [Thermodesulfobacteriota bacterium]